MNVPASNQQQSSPGYTTVRYDHSPSSPVGEQPLYDDVMTGRGRPAFQKQEDVGDLIEFSMTPAIVASATANNTSPTPRISFNSSPTTAASNTPPTQVPYPYNTGRPSPTRTSPIPPSPSALSTASTSSNQSSTSPSPSRGILHSNPFMMQDSKTKLAFPPSKPSASTVNSASPHPNRNHPVSTANGRGPINSAPRNVEQVAVSSYPVPQKRDFRNTPSSGGSSSVTSLETVIRGTYSYSSL